MRREHSSLTIRVKTCIFFFLLRLPASHPCRCVHLDCGYPPNTHLAKKSGEQQMCIYTNLTNPPTMGLVSGGRRVAQVLGWKNRAADAQSDLDLGHRVFRNFDKLTTGRSEGLYCFCPMFSIQVLSRTIKRSIGRKKIVSLFNRPFQPQQLEIVRYRRIF